MRNPLSITLLQEIFANPYTSSLRGDVVLYFQIHFKYLYTSYVHIFLIEMIQNVT